MDQLTTRRLELQSILEGIQGEGRVYYQPPESMKLKYPCIIYHRARVDLRKANDGNYLTNSRFTLTLIGKSPDNPVLMDVLSLPYASYERHYTADNLHHDIVEIYY